MLPKMDSGKEVLLLKKALDRQKKARAQAEKILEEKAKELYDVTHHLKESNARLEALLSEKTSELDGVFVNIVDPYVVMDLKFNIIKMNASAKEFLGYDSEKEAINLSTIVHPEYMEYTAESIQSLMEVGVLKNYQAKIIIKDKTEKYIQINSSLIYDKNRKPIAAQGIIRDITQETEIKHLLAEQKKELDIIVENSPLGIVLTVNNKIVKSNRTFKTLIGYSDFELKKLKLDDISSPEDIEKSKELINQMNTGELDQFSIIKKYTRKDNGILWAKTSVNAFKNSKGKVEYKVVMIEDITKELEAEEQLKESENRLATLISNLQTGVLLEDENRKISLTNKRFCSMFNISASPQQLNGVDCSDAAEQNKIFFKNPEAFVTRIGEILKERKLVSSDELEMIDGRILERDYIPIFNNKIYKGHLWTYQDITVRKNFRKNLFAEKEKYSSIIANMNLGLLEVDTNDTIQMANQSFCKMSGFSQDELLGTKAREILRVRELDLIEKQDRIRSKGDSDSYEVKVLNKSGEKKHWLISGAPRYDEGGILIGSIGIHLDITTQKKLEVQKGLLLKELENSNKGLQEYAHIVSHDLKSPLRSISALATWLYEDYKDVLDENGVTQLGLMQEKVEAMDNLIVGILNYSTVSSDTIQNTKVDVNMVIKEITDIIFIPDHVEVKIVKKLPTIFADKIKVHQVFQNFMSNAVVHIENEIGLVNIDYIETKTHWQFSIEDNGVGIPKEYHEKIFKIFQSVGNKERSTGIGLSIVKKIIDLYEGEVWLESTPGEGTTFYFTIKK